MLVQDITVNERTMGWVVVATADSMAMAGDLLAVATTLERQRLESSLKVTPTDKDRMHTRWTSCVG